MDMLAHMLSNLLVYLFLAGMIGSFLVVIFTVMRDLGQIFTKDDGTGSPDL